MLKIMSKEIKYSWVYPVYSENEINGRHWHLPKLGQKMDGVDDIRNIQPKQGSKTKDELPWLQIFEEYIRIGTDSIDWSKWNGTTWADIDSKLYYNNCKQFIPKQLYNALYNHLKEKYGYNFLAMQFSNSAKGFHIIFYFDVERTFENFKKCSMWTKQAVYDTFVACGAGDIITYKYGKSKVLDTCSNSPVQGIYLSEYRWTYGDMLNDDDFGKFNELDNITLNQAASLTNIYNTPLYVDGKETFDIINIRDVDKSEIKYYSHPYRRTIYEALITVYREKSIVDDYWNKIANMIPSENGHNSDFYIKEPNKNKWFEKYNNDTFHSIRILKDFGWQISFRNSYVFYDDMTRNWRKYIKNMVLDLFAHLKHNWDEIENEGNVRYLGNKQKYKNVESAVYDVLKEFKDKYRNNTIFDIEFDYLQDQEYTDKLQEYRDTYYKQRFEIKDFDHICNYAKAKDSMSYQYFMDLYYRDENNFPTVKYNVMEDTIFLYSYDRERMKVIWHPFKFNDEFVIWHNNDVYSNAMEAKMFMKSSEYFCSHNFGYNEIRDYLQSLDTENIDIEKLETFFIRHLDVEDNELNRKITKNFFIAAVKKQMEDKIFVFPHMLVLMGETGCGKSFINVAMFTINGKQFWTDTVDVDKEDKENGPLIKKNWLVLWNEGKGLSKKDNEANKRFMDKVNSEFTFQRKFENEITIVTPRNVVCYTTNNETIYSDASVTMDRRSWLLKCRAAANSMNEEKRKIILDEKDLIWATALKLYLDNPEQNLELDNNENIKLGEVQEGHKIITNEEIDEWFEDVIERPYQLTIFSGTNIPVFSSFDDFVRQNNIEKYEWKIPIPDNITNSLIPFDRIPVTYLNDFLKQSNKNNNFKILLERKMINNGWKKKVCGYPTVYNYKSTKMCWIKDKK